MIKSALIVLGIIVILLASTAVLGGVAFTKRTRNEAKELFKESDMTKPKVITEEDVQNLPEPVQRYLRYTQIIGKEEINTVRLKQGGYFRMKEDQKWMSITAEQYFRAVF